MRLHCLNFARVHTHRASHDTFRSALCSLLISRKGFLETRCFSTSGDRIVHEILSSYGEEIRLER